MLNAMGAARLEIMDERDEDKEREASPKKTAAPQPKVLVKIYTFENDVLIIRVTSLCQKYPDNK